LFGFGGFSFLSFGPERNRHGPRFDFSHASFSRYPDRLAGWGATVHRGRHGDTVSAEV
jgi:hypothetical protein